MKKLILPTLLIILLCYTFVHNDYYHFSEGLGSRAAIELIEKESR